VAPSHTHTTQAKHIVAAFAAQRHLVALAAASRKPAGSSPATGPGPEFVKLLAPLQTPLLAAGELRDKNRSQKDAFPLLSAVAEGAGAAGWVAVVRAATLRRAHGPPLLPAPPPRLLSLTDLCLSKTQEPKPAPYVTSMKESAQFYTNRVLKEARDAADKTPASWARAYIALLDALAAYVKEHHTTGLSWNPRVSVCVCVCVCARKEGRGASGWNAGVRVN
jgi:adenylyl cyclase-associated protein